MIADKLIQIGLTSIFSIPPVLTFRKDVEFVFENGKMLERITNNYQRNINSMFFFFLFSTSFKGDQVRVSTLVDEGCRAR